MAAHTDLTGGPGRGSATPATAALDAAAVIFTTHAYTVPAAGPENPHGYGVHAAVALQVDPQRIFKTLIVTVDGALLCAVVPVARQLDLKALARAVGGKKAAMADAAAAQRATGYVVGGISPLGQRTRLPVVIDASAQQFDTVLVSAGRRGLQVELAPADLIRAARAETAVIAAP